MSNSGGYGRSALIEFLRWNKVYSRVLSDGAALAADDSTIVTLALTVEGLAHDGPTVTRALALIDAGTCCSYVDWRNRVATGALP